MYEFFQGKLKEILPDRIVIEVNGIGYRLHIPLNNYDLLPQVEGTLLLYISFIVREDSHRLFGFIHKEQRNLFEKISEISGIGPKTALAILGHMELIELKRTIVENDIISLSKIPGIGKKTAERLIIELKDQMAKKDFSLVSFSSLSNTLFDDAIHALMQLGYHRQKAENAVAKAQALTKGKPIDIASLIKESLQAIKKLYE